MSKKKSREQKIFRRIITALVIAIFSVILVSASVVAAYRLLPGLGCSAVDDCTAETTAQTDASETTAPETVETDGGETETDAVPAAAELERMPTVLIDPGHGFDDVGCGSEFLGETWEKDLTLDMAKRLGTLLTERGCTVLYTHEGKSFPSVAELTAEAKRLGVEYEYEKMNDNNIFSAYERSIYANCLAAEQEIDFFLSIHVNAMENSPERSGFEIDYYAEGDDAAESRAYFNGIIASIADNLPDTGIDSWEDSWDEAFIVTKITRLPAVLIETGFASNASDAAYLLVEENRSELMSAVGDGILRGWREICAAG